jgi:putative ABC transport system permease protein
MRFYTFVFKNVWRRRTRSTLTLTGVAAAVGMFVTLVGISDSLEGTLLDLYRQRRIDLIISRADAVSPMSGTLKERLGADVAALPDVQAVCPGLVDFLSFENLGINGVVVQGWPAGAFMFAELQVLQGHGLTAESRGKKGIMLGKDLARNAKLKLGDRVDMSEEQYRVVGIYEGSDIENSMAILLLEDAQKLTGKAGLITGLTLRLKDQSEAAVEEVRAAIEGPVAEQAGEKGKVRAKAPQEFVNTQAQLRMFKVFAWAISVVALIIGVLFMLNTMVMSVFERTREIGILRAIGWQPSRVMRMILMESMLISVGGAIVGTAGGIGLTLLLSQMPFAKGAIQNSVSPGIMVKGFAIALVVGLLGAAYPAFHGTRLLPTEAIRHE